MNYKKITSVIYAAVLTLGMGISGSANAVGPALQIDAQGGTWIENDPNGDPDTTFCSTVVCNFYAIATPSGTLSEETILGTTFYLSIALYPQVDSGTDLGSIVVNGDTVNITADMVYGAPPLSDVDGGTSDTGDLQPHGIFDTYYTEIAITFVSTQTMTSHDVQTDGGDPEGKIGGTGAFYEKIVIDTTNLDASIELHLDLYNIAMVECRNNPNCDPDDLDTDLFAPFSHDGGTSSSTSTTTSSGQSTTSTTTSSGQSTTSTTTSSGQSSTGTGVPEPSTLALLGFGLLSGLMFNRKRKASA